MYFTFLTTAFAALAPVTIAAPTQHWPIFHGCSSENQTSLRRNIKDVIELSSVALAAFDTAAGAVSLISSDLDTLAREDTETLIVRWFGKDALPEGGKAEGPSHIRGVFQRSHGLLVSNSVPFRCVANCSDIVPDLAVEAFVGVDYTVEKGVVLLDEEYEGVNLCPVHFHHSPTVVAEMDAEPWYTGFNSTNKLNFLMSYDKWMPAPALVLHEMMHIPAVGLSKMILDVCNPGKTRKLGAYGVIAAQILAWQSPKLAIHNADNYARFAVDVFMAMKYQSLSTPASPDQVVDAEGKPFPKETLKRMGWVWEKPADKVASVEAQIDKIDSFPVITRKGIIQDDPRAFDDRYPLDCA